MNQQYKQVSALALPYHAIAGALTNAVAHFAKLKGLVELHLVRASV